MRKYTLPKTIPDKSGHHLGTTPPSVGIRTGGALQDIGPHEWAAE